MDPDARREQLLSAARQVFVQKGYYRAGVSDVIREAGVARGTFYNYFESKRAAFDAVLTRVIDEVLGAVRPIDVTRPVPAQVRSMLVSVVTTLTAHDVGRLLFAEAIGIDAEGDAAVRDFYERTLERLERALVTGQRMGVVREGPMALTARCLLGMVQTPLLLAVLQDQPVDAEALVDELYLMLTQGVMRVG